MPKMKTHKGAAKRFGVSGSGKVVRLKAWKGHHLDIKSSSRTRRESGKAVVDGTSAEQIRRVIAGLRELLMEQPVVDRESVQARLLRFGVRLTF